MNHHHGISGGQLMLAFLAGAVTGAAVALLASPRSGQENRESLKGWAHDAQDKAQRVPEKIKGAYGRASRAAKGAFKKGRHHDDAAELPPDAPVGDA